MIKQPSFLTTRLFSRLSGGLLACAYATFAAAHWAAYLRSGEWSLLLFCCAETLAAVFILLRQKPETVSAHNFDWLVAVAGTFVPLLFRPAPFGVAPLAKYAIAVGALFLIAGLVSLNRSMALVAAKRQLKTAGVYRLVRHPLYTSYLITFTSYLLVNSSLPNLLVYLLTMSMLFIRCHREEQHLQADSGYRAYMRRVNYRLIPFVY